jgi:hypothetical protein
MRVLIHSASFVLASFRIDGITIPFLAEFCEVGSKMRTAAIRTGELRNCPNVTMYSCRLLANLTVYNKKDSHLPIFIFSFLLTTLP